MQKYLERRAKFMHRVKDVYFATGCKLLAREAGIQALSPMSEIRPLSI